MRGRARERQDGPPALQAQERRHRRDPDLAARSNPSRDWLALHGDQQGARQDPPLPEHRGEAAGARDRQASTSSASCKRYDLSLEEGARRAGARSEALAQELGVGRKLDDLFAAVGYGKVSVRQVLAQLVPAREARRRRPAEAAGRSRTRSSACFAWATSASRCKGTDDLLDLPRQVLQPDHGRAHRRLHHARQGRLVHSRRLPERREPHVRPRAPHRRRVGARRRRAPTRCASPSGVEDRPGLLGRDHRGARADEDRHPRRRGAHLRRPAPRPSS